MPRNHAIASGDGDFRRQIRLRCGGENEAAYFARATMQHGKPPPIRQPDHQPLRQARHPGAMHSRHLPIGMRIPGAGEQIARRPFLKTAAAIKRAGRQIFLAIAGNHPNAACHDQVTAGGRIGAIGNHIAGADHAPRWNAAPRRFFQNGARCLQV